MNPQKHSPHVVAVVLNSISHDARVLKEAHALAEHGYKVTIIGIQDGNCAEPETRYPLGVHAIRIGEGLEEDIDIRAALVKDIIRWVLPAIVILAALAALIAAFFYLPDLIALVIALDATAVRALSMFIGLTFAAALAFAVRKRPFARAISAQLRDAAANLHRFRRHSHVRRQIAARAIALKPDVVHCHDLTGLLIGEECRRQGFAGKLVYDSHELYEDIPMASAWHRLRTRTVQNRMAPHLAGFVTINDSIANLLKRRHPTFPDPVIVKNAARCPARPPRYDGRLHEAAGLDPETRILLFQGGYSLRRGLVQLVQAAPYLPDGWAIVFMGWGRLEKTLQNQAEIVDPEGTRVRFVPRVPQDELVEWTAGASFGIIPYERFGLNHWFCTPNKLWEYPAANVPIMASPFPELRRVVEGADIGLLLPDPLKSEAIGWSLRSISSDRLAELRANCREFIERDNWSVYADRLCDLYDHITGHSVPTSTRPTQVPVHQ